MQISSARKERADEEDRMGVNIQYKGWDDRSDPKATMQALFNGGIPLNIPKERIVKNRVAYLMEILRSKKWSEKAIQAVEQDLTQLMGSDIAEQIISEKYRIVPKSRAGKSSVIRTVGKIAVVN
jgi:hypothetical protein